MKTMQARRWRQSPQCPQWPLLPACLAAIILGILGMHTFTSEPPGMSAGMGISVQHSTHHTATAMAAHEPSTSHDGDPAGSAPADSVSMTAPADPSMGDMVMLCSAMLLAAASSILLALRLRRFARTSLQRLTRPPQTLRAWVPARTGTGPPPVWAYSVIRC